MFNLSFSKPFYKESIDFQEFLEENPARGNIFRYFILNLSEFTISDLKKVDITPDDLGNFFNGIENRAYGIRVSMNEIRTKTGYNISKIQGVIRDFENYKSDVILKIRDYNNDGGNSSNYYLISPFLLAKNNDLRKITK